MQILVGEWMAWGNSHILYSNFSVIKMLWIFMKKLNFLKIIDMLIFM